MGWKPSDPVPPESDTEAYDEYIRYRLALRRADAKVDTEWDRERRGVEPKQTWGDVDLEAAEAQGVLVPTLGLCEGGLYYLLYAGLVHVVYGDSYAGKTWFTLVIAKQVLDAGGRVLFIDFEDDARGTVGRLARLGVARRHYIGPNRRFFYVRPEGSLSTDLDRANFEKLLKQRYDLVILDGVTEAMTLESLSPNFGPDVAIWQAMTPNRLASATGAAVVCIDHVAKDSDGSIIGSERKRSGLSGATFRLIAGAEAPFLDGEIGCATVRVGKDRHGQVNKHGTDYDPVTRTHLIAHFELDSTEDGVSVARVIPVVKPLSDEEIEEINAKKRQYRCWFMEEISRWFEDVVPEGESRSKVGVIRAMMAEREEKGRPKRRYCWREAVDFLLVEGFLSAPPYVKGRSFDLTFVKPYRMRDDPLSDQYDAAASEDVIESEGK